MSEEQDFSSDGTAKTVILNKRKASFSREQTVTSIPADISQGDISAAATIEAPPELDAVQSKDDTSTAATIVAPSELDAVQGKDDTSTAATTKASPKKGIAKGKKATSAAVTVKAPTKKSAAQKAPKARRAPDDALDHHVEAEMLRMRCGQLGLSIFFHNQAPVRS